MNILTATTSNGNTVSRNSTPIYKFAIVGTWGEDIENPEYCWRAFSNKRASLEAKLANFYNEYAMNKYPRMNWEFVEVEVAA
jgi:hypothetical protein